MATAGIVGALIALAAVNPFWEPPVGIFLNRRDQSREEVEASPPGAEEHSYLNRALSTRQIWFVGLIVSVGFLILAGRALDLQVRRGSVYRGLAEGNRVRIKTITAPRGLFYDRYGRLLSENTAALSVALVPYDLPREVSERDRIIQELSVAINMTPSELTKVWQDLIKRRGSSVDPHIIAANLPLEYGPSLGVLASSWRGVEVISRPIRVYPETRRESLTLSHILGFVGLVNEEELSSAQNQDYGLTDVIGKSGLELAFEPLLRGKNGQREVEVDALGEEQQLLTETAPAAGRNIWLTLDLDLQNAAEAALKAGIQRARARRGAVVILDPNDGSILAMVSWPAFDANEFTRGLSAEQYEALQNNPDNPLFNRVTQGLYPSGSTIKPLIAAAALSEGIITSATKYLSVGGFQVGQSFFPDWQAGGHGLADVKRAIAESINTFFYIIGGGYDGAPGLGIERIGEYARRFGLGEKTGIELPSEASGLIPTPAWKEKVKGVRWFIGDTYHVAIGQGDILVTPLQVASYLAAVANGGTLYQPHFELETSSAAGADHTRYVPVVKRQEVVGSSHLKVVREGLRQTVTAGSAKALLDLPLTVAGKTGTAEASGSRQPYAWFTGFAPFDSPQLVIAVLIEDAGEGSTYAVPVARDILQWWALHRLEN